MTPLVTIQILGLVYKLRASMLEKERTEEFSMLLALEGDVIDMEEYSLNNGEKNKNTKKSLGNKIKRKIKKGGR